MALNRMLVGSVAIAGTLAALATAPVASAEPRDLFLDELATLNIPLIGGTQDDTVGAGYHEKVIVVSGSSARMAEGNKDSPVDSAIIGVIDEIDFTAAEK